VNVILSKSEDFKVRHTNAIEPESVELLQTVKVCSYSGGDLETCH